MSPDVAVIRFANVELARAARRVVHRLSRIKATGIYGDDSRHRTLWDEYRFEAENGPTPTLASAWDATVRPIAGAVLDRMPEHLTRLLSWHLASFDENDPDDTVRMDLLVDGVMNATRIMALEWGADARRPRG